MASTTGGGDPHDVELLREEYGDRWTIEHADDVFHARQRGGEIWELPASRWAHDLADLRGQLEKFEADNFRTGDLP